MATAVAPAPAQSGGVHLPFVAGAHEWTQYIGQWQAQAGASAVALPRTDISAGGFLRSIVLEISWAGGVGGTLTADAPFNFLDLVQITDVNGAPLFGPLSGYNAYLAHVVNAATPRNDPAQLPGYSSTSASGKALLRIPIEIQHENAVGALPNQLSNATYQISATLQPAAVFGTGYTTAPTFTVLIRGEYWTQPSSSDGRNSYDQDPMLVGTTQNWSVNRRTITVGANQSAVIRTGNLIRNIVVVSRNASGVRDDTVMPDPIILYIDGVQLRVESQFYNTSAYLEKTMPGWTRPTGVFVIPFSHFGEAGFTGNDADGIGWYPTTQGTRLEFQGNSATAGTLDIILNDVLPYEAQASQRFDQSNSGTFHPAV